MPFKYTILHFFLLLFVNIVAVVRVCECGIRTSKIQHLVFMQTNLTTVTLCVAVPCIIYENSIDFVN